MVLPNAPSGSKRSRTGTPRRVGGARSDEYDLYERDGQFVLSVEMPGFDPEEIDLNWYEGRLTVAAEHEDDRRERQRRYRRTFRMPRRVDEEEIRARYENGILDVYLPTVDSTSKGKSIPIEE